MKDENYYNSVNQVDTIEEVDTYSRELWGHRRYELSVTDIAHLLKGGYLVFDDGEYSTAIKLKD